MSNPSIKIFSSLMASFKYMIFIWYFLYAFYFFFKVINILHCCPDLCEHLHTIILNSLSGKLHTLLYLSWFLETYLALFFGIYSLVSSCSLILCVVFCALNNTPTSLQDWTCIRENFFLILFFPSGGQWHVYTGPLAPRAKRFQILFLRWML